MSDLTDPQLARLLEDLPQMASRDLEVGDAVLISVSAIATELQRRREAHRQMLLEVESLEWFAQRPDSRHPVTQGAVLRVLEAIRKAGG